MTKKGREAAYLVSELRDLFARNLSVRAARRSKFDVDALMDIAYTQAHGEWHRAVPIVKALADQAPNSKVSLAERYVRHWAKVDGSELTPHYRRIALRAMAENASSASRRIGGAA